MGHGPMPAPPAGTMPAGTMPAPATLPAGRAEVILPPEIWQRIGVTVASVVEAPLVMTIRTVGIIQPNETKVAHIHVRTEGWVERLFVNYTGQTVNAGDRLLSIYSPQFLVAQQEFLTALTMAGTQVPGQEQMRQVTREKLQLLAVPEEEIE